LSDSNADQMLQFNCRPPFIQIIFTLVAFSGKVSFAQSSQDKLVGIYSSNANKFERYSVMSLEADKRFTYKYGLGGCQGEVKGTWEISDRKVKFKNDLVFTSDSIVLHPNLGLSTWSVNGRGIRPDQAVDSGCLKEDNLHLKAGVILESDFDISLVKLIATPEKYHEKKIRVTGFMNLEFEGDAIYLHKEDYEKSLSKNGFWVAFSDKLDRKEIIKLNKGYVLIEGTFNMDRHGHMGLFGGEIYNITRVIKWGDFR